VTARQLTPLRVVVRSSNWLGDAVMNVPAVQAVKKGRPDVHLTVLAPAKLADVWREVPEVDEVLVIGPRESIFSVAGRLRRGRFDAAIILPNSLRTALEVFLAGVPRRAGFAGHRRRWLLNQVAKGRKKRRSQPHTLRPEHHAKNYLRLVQEFGAGEPPVWPDSRSLAPSNQPPVLGLCPGAEYGPAKRWPVEKYRAVMEKISAATDAEWRIFGVAKDRPLAAILCENFPGRVVDRTGQTTLRELLEELREVRLLVTNDTGTMHLAALLGTPTVAIFGSTEPSLTGPLGEGHVVLRHQVECSPCFLRECPLDFRCMEGVTVDAVVEAIRRLV
jgi:lipopolysaccharide heptosyltransferase II